MYCKICGAQDERLKITRFWSPDDGWLVGRLCPYCLEHYGNRQPQKEDYAYREAPEFVNENESELDDIEHYLEGRTL